MSQEQNGLGRIPPGTTFKVRGVGSSLEIKKDHLTGELSKEDFWKRLKKADDLRLKYILNVVSNGLDNAQIRAGILVVGSAATPLEYGTYRDIDLNVYAYDTDFESRENAILGEVVIGALNEDKRSVSGREYTEILPWADPQGRPITYKAGIFTLIGWYKTTIIEFRFSAPGAAMYVDNLLLTRQSGMAFCELARPKIKDRANFDIIS